MTEFMDLTSIAKLYGAKGEYSKLYDSQGRVIWQSLLPVGTVLWDKGLYFTGKGTADVLLNDDPLNSENGLMLTVARQATGDGSPKDIKIPMGQLSDLSDYTLKFDDGTTSGYVITWFLTLVGLKLTITANSSGAHGFGGLKKITTY